MSGDLSVSLGEHYSAFVKAQVGRDGYDSPADVIRAALRLLEEQDAKLAALRTALVQGEESGVSKLTIQDIWSDVGSIGQGAGIYPIP